MQRRKLLLGALCTALAAPAAHGQDESAWRRTREQYFAILIGGKKVGHAVHRRHVADGKVKNAVTTAFSIVRMGTPMKVRVSETAIETADGKPLAFANVQQIGALGTNVTGTVDETGKATITMVILNTKKTTTVQWPEGALLPEGLLLLSRKKGLKEGTKYTVKTFSPMLLKALDNEVTVGPTKDVDLLGRIVRLTEVTTKVTGPTGTLRSTEYVNEKGRGLKSLTPMLGKTMEMVACTKSFALSKSDVVDFFEKVLAPSPQPLSGVRTAKSITYRLRPTEKEAKLELLKGPSQRVVRNADGTVSVTVAPAAAPAGAALPYKGKDGEARKALKPSHYLQCDEKEIVALARKAVAGAKDAAKAAQRIEKFVGEYINDKNLSVGYATALEVARSRQGDCSEHAALAAAMCRAVGLPAQMVTGLVYVERVGTQRDVFAPHAWFRAYVGGKWIDYDAAAKGFHAGHIAFTAGDGDPEEFFGVVNTLGCFKIMKVTIER